MLFVLIPKQNEIDVWIEHLGGLENIEILKRTQSWCLKEEIILSFVQFNMHQQVLGRIADHNVWSIYFLNFVIVKLFAFDLDELS